MSKKLVYLFALICSIGLFTGCSDDEEEIVDNSWEELVGDYSGENLVLSYGDMALTGKKVSFSATSGNNGKLLLNNIIPGENETTISNVEVKNSEFSGTATTTYANVEYAGSVKEKVMTLKLTVVMNDPNGWAKTYSLADYTTGSIDGTITTLTGGLYMNWDAPDYVAAGSIAGLIRTIGGVIFPQVLQTVTLETDGNITASYYKGAIHFDPEMIKGLLFGTASAPTSEEVKALIPTSGWLEAPKNLAHWFVKDNKLYVKLNIIAIISQTTGENVDGMTEIISQILQGDPATIKGLLSNMLGVDFSSISDETFNMLLDWVNNGVPMSVSNKNGNTQMCLDKSALTPLMVDPTLETTYGMNADLIKIWLLLSDAKIIPSEASAAFMLLLNMPQNWDKTNAFDLGLDLKAN
ncbi:DUF4925 domain-containing protein [Parabacteroides goldsteinii]|jgi:hypothetical protein bfra3_18821|uniref:DUF4925 domain-containing protein n=1 Tax=Parabacteroides goldsteinii TaxID=328812 RepID=UPI00189BC614|nr:DUF4925 domain-containing protein [Parabacteroides goldsteinii]